MKGALVDAEFIAKTGRAAEESFASGLYCAESVVLAVAKARGLESDILPRVATGFCTGMSRTCGTCGALTGAIMGIGLALGRDEAGRSVEPCYEATQRMIAEFEHEFGSGNCRDLLGCDLGTPEGQASFREDDLIVRCARFTRRAAEMAIRLVGQHG